MMNTDFVRNRTGAGLFNCGFRSTKDIATKSGYLFAWIMDALMLGIGVGFDTLGADTTSIYLPIFTDNVHYISDDREGWVESVRILLDGYLCGNKVPLFDYSLIRPAGQPIKGFGGTSSGHAPLKELHESLIALLSEQVGKKISSEVIVDICNLIGRCVVAGNVRRSAEIAIGNPNDRKFVLLKQDKEKLEHHRWCSNNSVAAELGMDYIWHAEQTVVNGEPGYIWLQNARTRGRFIDPIRLDDIGVMGFNPCVEQQLHDAELCCLTETYPSRHESYEDWQQTLKIAYLYGKTVTLARTQWPETNQVMQSHRRIGTSITGFVQAAHKFGWHNMWKWCDNGYNYLKELDAIYSNWLCIPRSIRMTSVKPSGTVSKLFGVTPGCHFPEHEHYIQRIRFSTDTDIWKQLRDSGYNVEPCVYSPNTMVVEFPIKEPYFERSKADVSMWEQLEIAAKLQHYWADNSVSVTVTFRDHEANDVAHALDLYQDRLKAVSFLRYKETGYLQAPMEPISLERFNEMQSKIASYTTLSQSEDGEGESFCTNDGCLIDYAALAAAK